MGTVLAMLLAEKQNPVRLWGYDAQQLKQIAQNRENVKFLPGHKLPETIIFEHDDKKIIVDADLIISAVPCQFMRSIWIRLKKHTPKGVPVCSVAKGIENKTLLRPTQIIADVLGYDASRGLAALSGPTIADELAVRLPATACVASAYDQLAQRIQLTLSISWFRIYTNTDVVGVELAGAMKNIIAIAAGIIDGIGAGDNAKAALLCRGLAEISRLGVAMGATRRPSRASQVSAIWLQPAFPQRAGTVPSAKESARASPPSLPNPPPNPLSRASPPANPLSMGCCSNTKSRCPLRRPFTMSSLRTNPSSPPLAT